VFEREKFKEGNEMKSRWIATCGREGGKEGGSV